MKCALIKTEEQMAAQQKYWCFIWSLESIGKERLTMNKCIDVVAIYYMIS